MTLDDVVADFRGRLLAREAGVLAQVLRDYHDIVTALLEELSNQDLTKLRRARLDALLGEVVVKLEKVTGRTYAQIVGEIRHAVPAGAEFAIAALTAVGETSLPPGVTASWASLPDRQIDAIMAAFTDPKSPLQTTLATLPKETRASLRSEIIRGIALGRNPRAVVGRVETVMNVTRARLLTIARTEMLRAQRSTAMEMYRANGNVIGRWRWVATLDRRTCALCWSLHGREFPLDVPFAGHPNDRCAPVPVTSSWKDLGFDIPEPPKHTERGEDVFRKMPTVDQIVILGPGKYRAWQAGAFDFDELAGERTDPRWGLVRYERPLFELLRKRKAA